MVESTPEALQRQIADLQHQLDVSRKEQGTDSAAPYERAEVHAAVGEQIQQEVPSYQVPTTQTPASTGTDVPSYQDPALAPQVQALVNVAFTQGVQTAIQQAAKTGNPALIDALHDVLADELHQQLVDRQKVGPAV